MDIRSGIAATAQALGISPVDLATVISYETAGTFNPTIAGPTTQWGRHRGLIQFGEPQAKQYGVDWNDPVGSQLGPDGAIAKYMRQAGVQPGMGLLDVYSAVNAGRVGRYNASDANNGGAPGTVRDKVNDQMAGHRAKAVAMFGDDPGAIAGDTMRALGQQGQGMNGLLSTQTEPQQKPRVLDTLRNSAMDGSLMDGLAMAFNSLRHQPDQGLAQMVQGRMQARQSDSRDSAQMNRTAEWLSSQPGMGDLAEGVRSGAITAAQAFSIAQSRAQAGQPDIIEVNGQLVDRKTGQVMGDYRDAPKPQELDLGAVNTLRDDARTQLQPFELAREGYERISTLYDNPGAVSDYALAVSFAKILDPGSVAREGEVSAVANNGSLPARIQQQLLAVLQGNGQLPPAVRDEIVGLAETMYRQQANTAMGTAADYGRIAQQANIPSNMIMPGMNVPGTSAPPQRPQNLPQVPMPQQAPQPQPMPQVAPPPQAPQAQPMPQQAPGQMPQPPNGIDPNMWPMLWQNMTPEERALFQ